MKLIAALSLVVVLVASGCSCAMDLGHDRTDGGTRDASIQPRTDECGNGIDDDRNGRIDDGCFCVVGEMQRCFSGEYPGRRVGACRDGQQRCEPGPGIEFDDWGNFACMGEILPVTERCDGTDADCDGAIDEGCPCTGGETRGCGTEFVTAPCTPGTQTCRGGAWSGCEGAIGPSADVCEDMIDNDCDGLIDDLCTCVSEPERCADGLDNDCDGVTDEADCTPRHVEDAGVPDASCAGSICDVAPRPIAPLSTSTVTSRRPTLRWENPSGVSEARVELCRDRGCTMPLSTLDGTDSARPSSELPDGWVFWRLRSRAGTAVGEAASPTWQFWVGARNADGDRDTSWGSVLDLDGDGHTDIAVGAPGVDVERGTVSVYRGQSAGIGASPDWTISGARRSDQLGRAVASAGDVDGDGFGDLLLGTAMGITSAGYRLGYVWIVRGSAIGPAAAPDAVIEGTDLSHPAIGTSVAALGDVNGDGYADIGVSFPGSLLDDHSYVGVYAGSATGISTTAPTWRLMGRAEDKELAGTLSDAGDLNADGFGDFVVQHGLVADGIELHPGHATVFLGGPSGPARSVEIDGEEPQALLGNSMACAGDVNGDGYADLLIGAEGGDDYVHGHGRVYLFRGGPAGLVAPASWMIRSAAEVDHLGAAVATAGDLDHDGYADIVASASAASAGGRMWAGTVSVYRGGPSGLSATPLVVLEGGADLYGLGASVSGAGDTNGDGFEDIVIGAANRRSGSGPPPVGLGAIDVFLGAAAGISAVAMPHIDGPSDQSYFGTSVGRAN